jgi:hypothetical protein
MSQRRTSRRKNHKRNPVQMFRAMHASIIGEIRQLQSQGQLYPETRKALLQLAKKQLGPVYFKEFWNSEFSNELDDGKEI